MRSLIIVSGGRDGGKTTKMWKLYNEFTLLPQVRIGGYITRAADKSFPKREYTLIDLSSKQELKVACEIRPEGEDWFFQGKRYWFSQRTFDETLDTYCKCTRYTHLFMDEAGRLELNNRGFAPGLMNILENFDGTFIVAVRDSLIDEFLEKYPFRQKYDRIEIETN